MTAAARPGPSILEEILRHKADELAGAKAARPLRELEDLAREMAPTRGLAEALFRPPGAPVRAIAEIKRASPSVGPIRPGADPAAVAREYAAAGAAAISVLTDQTFFDGHLDFLGQVRAAVGVPLLRKDFIIDPYQLVEARVAGADGVLLIATALAPGQLGELLAHASGLGLDGLVEVSSEEDAELALAAGARLIGVNHRNLRTFAVDMSITARLAPLLPAGVVLVAESGIRTAEDVRHLATVGAHAVLVGETLMRAPSPGAALAQLFGAST